jgi:hypothetical protein
MPAIAPSIIHRDAVAALARESVEVVTAFENLQILARRRYGRNA